MSVLSLEQWRMKSDANGDAVRAAAARYAEHYKRENESEPLAFWLRSREDPAVLVHAAMFDETRDLEAELRCPSRANLTTQLMDQVVRDDSPSIETFDVDTTGGGVEKEIQLLEETDQIAVIFDFVLTGGLPLGMDAVRDYLRSLDEDPAGVTATIFGCDRNDVRRCFALTVFSSLEAMEKVRDGRAMGRLAERLLPEIDDPDAFTRGTYDVLLSTGGVLGSASEDRSGRDISPSASL